MAFRKKAEIILKHKPDILVVPECEHPDKLLFGNNTKVPTDIFWYGQNRNKGLAIFSYSKYNFKLLDVHNPNFKSIIPISVTGGKIDFTMFAIWANNPEDKDGQYVTQIWKAVNFYDNIIEKTNTILIGDFNSNTIWDKPKRNGNHSDVVRKLAAKNIHSTYHNFHKQEHGLEKHPTFLLYRHLDKPYHIDYCFASNDFLSKLKKVEIGKHKDWSKFSDHNPVIITFNFD